MPAFNPHVRNQGHTRRIVERVLGKKLPFGAVIHHVDEDPTNNANNNLLVCPDNAYHQELHGRLRAFKATGHADWRKCSFCKQWGSPEHVSLGGKVKYHRTCATAYQRRRQHLPAIAKPHRKLQGADIPAIFQLHKDGLSLSQIAEQFRVQATTIWHVLHRRTWTHISIDQLGENQ